MALVNSKRQNRSDNLGPQTRPVVKWQRKQSAPLRHDLLHSLTTVYTTAPNGIITAHNAEQGDIRWQRNLHALIDASGALSAKGVLYVGSRKGMVWALDAQNGKVIWTHKLSSGLSADILLANDTLYLGNRGITALTLDGAERWHVAEPSAVYGSPAWHPKGFVVYATMHGELVALDANGKRRWRSEIAGGADAGPSLGEQGFIYVGTYLGNLIALDADGQVQWQSKVDSPLYAALSVGKDHLLRVASAQGEVLGVDARTGSIQWRFSTGEAISAAPTIAQEGAIYVGTEGNMVYSLSSRGHLLWTMALGAPIVVPPLLLPRHLIVASTDGYLQALGFSHD